MITMHVGDEDGIELGEVDMGTTGTASVHPRHNLSYSTFPHLYELRGGIVFQGWQRTATPQYMYSLNGSNLI